MQNAAWNVFFNILGIYDGRLKVILVENDWKSI